MLKLVILMLKWQVEVPHFTNVSILLHTYLIEHIYSPLGMLQ